MAAMHGRTVTVSSFFERGHPQLLKADVCNYLNKSGIQRVLVGHKPFGDSPTILRNASVEAIDADTSFSDPTKPDNR